ncbi:MAG: hypothetical protein ACHREM_00545 [Polyangiales bacterium]
MATYRIWEYTWRKFRAPWEIEAETPEEAVLKVVKGRYLDAMHSDHGQSYEIDTPTGETLYRRVEVRITHEVRTFKVPKS